MTARVTPNDAMRLVLRRVQGHGRDSKQIDAGPHWITGCPTENHIAPVVRWDQHTNGKISVHPCIKGCTTDQILTGLDLDDPRIRAHSNGQDPFTKPGRTRGRRTSGDALEIYEKLKAALDADFDDGRGRTGRYQCPACGAKGDGHGLKVDYDPNRPRRILLLCFQGCPVEEILEPLGMTKAELCADDDTDDLGEADSQPPPETEPTESGVSSSDPEADLANARRLVAVFGERLRYVVAWKKWLCWDGQRWKPDDTGQAVRYAKIIADHLPTYTSRGVPTRTQTAAGISAMLTLAGTEPEVALAPKQLDSDPYLLNVANGTFDLRTGQLRPHDPADLLTKICNAAYRPGAAMPTFTTFVRRVQPDEDMRTFLARLFGHALLGKVVEHILAILYGVGANGKTTLVEAVTFTLGDYARPVDPGLLVDRGEVHPTGTAALFGLRLAVTHETDQGRRLAEATVKRLTGGDKITARRMREDFWDFDPSHSIVMHTNHKPIVRGTDEGIWRRLRFVPFGVVVPGDEQDKDLPDALRLEADGILEWLIAGYRAWQRNGLDEPDQVTTATSAFRGESDMLGLFLEGRCMRNPNAHVQSSKLFAAWVDWCKRENLDAGTQTAFSRELTDRGFDKAKDGLGRMTWHGIDLYADETGD